MAERYSPNRQGNLMKQAFTVLGAAVGIGAALFLLAYFGLGMKRYFAPKHAEADRVIFEQTPSFVHGKSQYIARLRLQYEQADTESARTSLRTLILDEAAAVDWTLLPPATQAFLETL